MIGTPEDFLLQVARVESRAGDSAVSRRNRPSKRRLNGPMRSRSPKINSSDSEQAPIEERPASAAEVFNAPARCRVMKNGMAPLIPTESGRIALASAPLPKTRPSLSGIGARPDSGRKLVAQGSTAQTSTTRFFSRFLASNRSEAPHAHRMNDVHDGGALLQGLDHVVSSLQGNRHVFSRISHRCQRNRGPQKRLLDRQRIFGFAVASASPEGRRTSSGPTFTLPVAKGMVTILPIPRARSTCT